MRRTESGYAADIFTEDLLEKHLEPSVDTEAGGCRREGLSAGGDAVFGSTGKQTLTFTGSQHCDDDHAEAKRQSARAARARVREHWAFPLSEKFMSKISEHGAFI